MRRYVSSHWFIGLILALSVLLIGGNFALRSSKGARQDQVATIVNETDSLKVEDLKITDPRPGEKQYNFSLRNTSNKEVVAWVIETPTVTQTMGGVIGGLGLAPGKTRTAEVYDTSANRPEGKKIVIKLVVFDDGSSEGDFKLHKEVAESREGSRLQTERINAVIEKALLDRKAHPNQGGEKRWLESVTAAISALPETAPPDRPMMARGMNSPKQMALWTIALLDEWEEKRHQAPEQAGKILKQSDVLSGTLNLEEGLSKIVGDNRRTIAKGAK